MIAAEIKARAKALQQCGGGRDFDHGVGLLTTALTGDVAIFHSEILPAAEALIASSRNQQTRCGIIAMAWILGERGVVLPRQDEQTAVYVIEAEAELIT